MTDAAIHDLFVIGGGINGTGIAADAAGRGLSVALAEMSDLASGTSSASSKLIHGGLRYLEYYEFRLVREALGEREVLLKKAPHLIWPLRFVLPHVPGVRPRWMIRTGLFLYDHLHSRRVIPGSRGIDLANDPAGRPLKSEYAKGFTYWDAWVDDARLVVLNAKAARDKGARIMTRTRVVKCHTVDGVWRIVLEADGRQWEERARALVNAAGPWVDGVDALATRDERRSNAHHVRLIKGSHIVVPRITGANDAYLMQSSDRRVVFVLPFEGRFTIIGTTDIPFTGDPASVAAGRDEELYLLELVAEFFKTKLTPADVVWRYSGVRSLFDDASDNPSAITRDYHLMLDANGGQPPRLSVYGGKVTTYRRLSEEALGHLEPYFSGKAGKAWTADAALPGGDMPGGSFDIFLKDVMRRYPKFEATWLERLARRHGTLMHAILDDAKEPADLGAALGFGLSEREVRYMKAQEWAVTPEDVLWRRTKLGLHALTQRTSDEQRRLTEAIAGML